MIETVNMRLLSKKIKGEETPKTYNFDAMLISTDELGVDTVMTTLGTVIPGWGATDDFNEEWMKALREGTVKTATKRFFSTVKKTNPDSAVIRLFELYWYTYSISNLGNCR